MLAHQKCTDSANKIPRRDWREDRRVVRLLLLGTGNIKAHAFFSLLTMTNLISSSDTNSHLIFWHDSH